MVKLERDIESLDDEDGFQPIESNNYIPMENKVIKPRKLASKNAEGI